VNTNTEKWMSGENSLYEAYCSGWLIWI
jgi:hypothetical protein